MPEYESEVPTPWAVRCREQETRQESCNAGELLYLTKEYYTAQMNDPYSTWRCPRCGGSAVWDDDNYETYLEGQETLCLPEKDENDA